MGEGKLLRRTLPRSWLFCNGRSSLSLEDGVDPLGTPCRELLRQGASRLHTNLAQAIICSVRVFDRLEAARRPLKPGTHETYSILIRFRKQLETVLPSQFPGEVTDGTVLSIENCLAS